MTKPILGVGLIVAPPSGLNSFEGGNPEDPQLRTSLNALEWVFKKAAYDPTF